MTTPAALFYSLHFESLRERWGFYKLRYGLEWMPWEPPSEADLRAVSRATVREDARAKPHRTRTLAAVAGLPRPEPAVNE